MNLFEQVAREAGDENRPLADVLRPESPDAFLGQQHLMGPGRPIRKMIETGKPVSMILWGPPGVGKTTLAILIARACKADFEQLSAVSSGVAEVKKIIEKAKKNKLVGIKTILFIDEIHRFNKAQQDALLHAVEDGTLVLIGATTENPSFEVIGPLLSRCRVFVLQPLEREDLNRLLNRGCEAMEKKLARPLSLSNEAREVLLQLAGGDGRELLNGLELAAMLAEDKKQPHIELTVEVLQQAFQRRIPRYDKNADHHYDTISAFIKSLRGSDPNAALHYLARMVEAGEQPEFIARRLVIFASEDVGNADPQALPMAVAAFHAVQLIGMPEGAIVLAQVTTYLASAPKSNASYAALKNALNDVRSKPLEPIPLHLRNAPTSLMAELGYGKDYKYPHDYPGGFVQENYMPENLKGTVYYRPRQSGAEKDILSRLRKLWPDLYQSGDDSDS